MFRYGAFLSLSALLLFMLAASLLRPTLGVMH